MPFIESIAAMLGFIQAGKQAVNQLNESLHAATEANNAAPVEPEKVVRKPLSWEEFKSQGFHEMGRKLALSGPNATTYQSELESLQSQAEEIFEDEAEQCQKNLIAIDKLVVNQRNLPGFLPETFELMRKEQERLLEKAVKDRKDVRENEGRFRMIFKKFDSGYKQGVAEYNRDTDFLNNKNNY